MAFETQQTSAKFADREFDFAQISNFQRMTAKWAATAAS